MERNLKEYDRKRDFRKSTEPVGKIEKPSEKLRFAVQRHNARSNHFDLRLEWDGVLLSWAVPKGPSYDPHDKRLAVRVEDHPLDYRNFEGTIPEKEYGGGVVMLWDEGFWEPLTDVEKGLKEGSLKLIIKGKRMKGKWALVRMKAKEEMNEKNWLLIKEKDKEVMDDDGISGFTTSIRTGRTMEEIQKGKSVDLPFDEVSVQLPVLVDKAPAGDEWIYELKYDGYRILAYLDGKRVRLMTRNGQDYTRKFQIMAETLLEWADGRTMVLDGEMVVLDSKGKTDFQALQRYIQNPRGKSLTYALFDLLALTGSDLRREPLIKRKEMLRSLLEDAPENLYYSNHTRGSAQDILIAACKANMEGILCKRADSIYSGSRNGDWLKMKCDTRQEFVIGGYTLTDKKRAGVSALLLGVYDGQDLVYAGRAGTGFTQKTMDMLEEKFREIKSQSSPFRDAPDKRSDETITWLEPTLIAEIRFAEWSDENLLIQASYKGLRTDKEPQDVVREDMKDKEEERLEENPKPKKNDHKSILVSSVKVSSPDKELFEGSGITKEDVARYYAEVAGRMMPYVGNRVLSFVRCPDGVPSECFYQKHLHQAAEGLGKLPVRENSGDVEDYFFIRNVQGLIYSVQIGTLEFHVWGSQIEHLEKPDMMVFDLDPDEGMDLNRLREGVRDMKMVLDELSLESFLKTSGGKGYHLVVPLEPVADWDTVREFAKLMAKVMEQRWPDRYTSNMRKEKRKGKIFIDWIRNNRTATSIAPYSLRARKGAPVSMPISWDELDRVEPNGIGMEEAMRRIAEEDPWKDFYRTSQSLKK